MTLPEWDSDTGLLPPGRHRTTFDGVHQRFVEDAPHREHRQRLFSALVLHSELISAYLPSGAALWINGGFSQRKESPPHDVDVAIRPNNWADIDEWTEQQYGDILGLITLQNAIIEHPWPASVDRIQPVGALLDAFIVFDGTADQWHETWSSVKVNGIIEPGIVKGYAEVLL